jgi:TonB family protein
LETVGTLVAPTKLKNPNPTTVCSTLVLLLAGSSLWLIHDCFARDIFHNASDRVREHLSNLDRQFNASKKSGNVSKPVIHDKWAFMVGVSKYQDKEIKPMKAARNNAVLLSSTLKEPNVGHFGAGHVAEVVGAAATRDSILGALFSSALIKKSLPTDLIVLYFSGRTLVAQDKNDICLCAYDTLSTEPELSGISLRETLASFKRRTQCPQILCILDCSPNQPPKLKKGECLSVDDLAKETGVSVLSASVLDGNSQACGSGTISCFAQFLTEALKDSQGYVSVGQLVDYVQNNIALEESGSTSVKQKVIFANAPGSDRIGEAMIGASIHTPWNVSKMAMGHNVQTLALVRPDLVGPPTSSSAPVLDLRNVAGAKEIASPRIAKIINGETPPDEDDASSGSNPAVSLDTYIANVKTQIKQKWIPPKGLKDHQVVTTFTVLKNGLIVEPVVAASSGNAAVDQSALDALKAASPLEPLPKGAPTSIQIRYVFDWRVVGK